MCFSVSLMFSGQTSFSAGKQTDIEHPQGVSAQCTRGTEKSCRTIGTRSVCDQTLPV